MEELQENNGGNISHSTVMNILGMLVAALVIIAVAFSPIFVLRNINIKGNKYITNEEICQIANIAEGENLFQLQTDEIKETLLKDLRIEQVTVKRSFPSGLDIEVTERIPLAIVACEYGYLDIGKDGMVLAAHRTLSSVPIPLVSGISVADLFVGDKISDNNLMAVLEYVGMLNDFSRQQISEINISDPEHVMAYTNNAVQIRIGRMERLEEKSGITNNFVAELQVAKYPIEYIDFQYSTPFIKFKNN